MLLVPSVGFFFKINFSSLKRYFRNTIRVSKGSDNTDHDLVGGELRKNYDGGVGAERLPPPHSYKGQA